jgi:hypothetical protein
MTTSEYLRQPAETVIARWAPAAAAQLAAERSARALVYPSPSPSKPPPILLRGPVAAIPVNPGADIEQRIEPQPNLRDTKEKEDMTNRETMQYLMSIPPTTKVDIGGGRVVEAHKAIRMLLNKDSVTIEPGQAPQGYSQPNFGGARIEASQEAVERLSQADYDKQASGEGIEGFTTAHKTRVHRRQSGTTAVSSFNLRDGAVDHSEGPSYGVTRGADGQPKLSDATDQKRTRIVSENTGAYRWRAISED